MTPWTIDQNALSAASVTMAQSGDVATFSWGAAPNVQTASVHIPDGVANFFPERSAQQTALMTLLGLLKP